jgi:MFS family permease
MTARAIPRSWGAGDGLLPWAFVVMMVTWMLVVWPAGRLADRIGRRPLLLLGWGAMTVRLALVAFARAPWQVLATEVLDGLAQGLFAVLAAAWVTDRLGGPRRAGEAQVLVGSALVGGSAAGLVLSFLVIDALGYRSLFGLLAGVGAVATGLVFALVPETLPARIDRTQESRQRPPGRACPRFAERAAGPPPSVRQSPTHGQRDDRRGARDGPAPCRGLPGGRPALPLADRPGGGAVPGVPGHPGPEQHRGLLAAPA